MKNLHQNTQFPLKNKGFQSLILFAMILALTACGASSGSPDGQSSSRKERNAAEFEKVAALVNGGNYQYTIRTATATGGRTIQITSEYTMAAREGNYEAYLPYFGRAHQASYGGDGGIEFSGKPQDLQIVRNERKNTLSVTFRIKGKTDDYSVQLEVGASGYGTLGVSGQKRQGISYYGLVGELRD